MTTTMGIAFSSQRCDAIVMQEHHDNRVCLAKKSFAADFQDKKTLTRTVNTLKSYATKQTRIIVGIPIAQAMMQQLNIDATLSDDDVNQYLNNQVESFFGEKSESLYWDYETQSKNADHHSIMLVAIAKTRIKEIEQAFSQSNLKITAIEPDAVALARAISTSKNAYALMAQDGQFLFISGRDGKLIRCETLPLELNAQHLSPIISMIEPESDVIFIATPETEARFLSIQNAFHQHHITLLHSNLSSYTVADSLCSWRLS